MSSTNRFTTMQMRFFNTLGRDNELTNRDHWPHMKTLERWTRQKSFRRRFNSASQALAVEIRIHLLAAAVVAARNLASPPENGSPEPSALTFSKIETIRLALSIHSAIRNSKKQKSPSIPPSPTFEQWVADHPNPEQIREKAIASLQNQPQPPSNGN